MTTDGHGSYPRAIRTVLGKTVRHRTSAYLNNRLEQDHRGIKGRIRCMRGFKSHDAATASAASTANFETFSVAAAVTTSVSASLRRFRFARGARVALGIMQNA